MRKLSISHLFIFVMLAMASSQLALSQATASGTVSGTVTDTSGAAISGASVTVTSRSTSLTRMTHADSVGFYRFDQLPVGMYQVRVESAGFASAVIPTVELVIGSALTLNLSLGPGRITETVQVSTADSLVDTQKSDISASITPQQVQDLPLNGRDIGTLAILAPGVRPVDNYDSTKTRYATFGVNGSSGRSSNATVNGIDNKDSTVGGAVMQLPLEAVEEFSVGANRFSAANGRSEGSALNIVTKSGSNAYHGSLYGFFRNDVFNAIDQLDKQAGNPKPAYSRQQYGGSLGGPVRKDRDFLFFAYEHLRERSALTVTPQAYAELSLLTAFGAVPAISIPTPYDDTRYNGRFDHIVTEKTKFSFVYTGQSNKATNDQSSQTNDLTAGNYTRNDLSLASASLTSVLSSRLVNTVAFGYQYWNDVIGTNYPKATYFFSNGIYFGTNVQVAQQSYQGKWQFKDDIAWNIGHHTLTAGVDYLWLPKLTGFGPFSPAPVYNFAQLPSYYESNAQLYPQGISTPGAVSSISIATGNAYAMNPGEKTVGMYAQDDWKVSHRLNVSLGLRYDKDMQTYGGAQQANNRAYQELHAIGSPYAGIPYPGSLDFSPRIGFTYDVNGKGTFLLHGGYGLYFGLTQLGIPWNMLTESATTVATIITVQGQNIVPGTNIPVSNYRVGVDPAPTPPPASTQVAPGSFASIMDPKFRDPYSQQINFGFQWAPFANAVTVVDYVQSRGLHSSRWVNINPLDPNTGVPVLTAAFQAANQTVLGQITDNQSVNRSNYNALNVSFRQRYSKRFSALVNFTWSKALTYEGSADDFMNVATRPSTLFYRGDYGPAPSDSTLRVVAAGVIRLPWKVEVAPIIQAESARPYDPQQASASAGFLGYGTTTVGAPHLVVPVKSPHDYTALANLTADQYRACLAAKSCTELRFDSFRGTPYIQLDARFSKDLTFGDKGKLRLFFQAFNVSNRANWGNNYDGNVQDSSFRKPSGYMNPSSTLFPHSFLGEWGIQYNF